MKIGSQTLRWLLSSALVIALVTAALNAQEARQRGPGGPGGPPPSDAGKPGGPPSGTPGPGGPTPPPGMTPPGGPGGPGGPPPEAAKPVQRPPKPETPPKPEELNARPDEAGKIHFSFNGQPWPKALEWLATVSKMNFDWQELPGDYLNLSTPDEKSYTIREVRDLINQQLLRRGYTLLCNDDVLTAVDIKKLNPSMVPRLKPEELDQHDPYEFAKVSFPLGNIPAETVVDELNSMKSLNGTLTRLKEINRIEAMDAVANLREIYAVLKDAQSTENQQQLTKRIPLHYARAADVCDQLETLLGLEKRPRPAPSGAPSFPGRPDQPMPSGPSGGGQGADIRARLKTAASVMPDERENCIIATARPDKMAIIEQAIKTIDVPRDHERSLAGEIQRTQRYNIAGIDPEIIVKTLQQLGDLSPITKLQIDKKNNAIIAYAPLADHVLIAAAVERLSGSERRFDVRRLHMPADLVAGSVMFMMGIDPKKKKEAPRPWWAGGGGQQGPTERVNEFRVDADIERNWLLLYGNDVELKEVDDLLVKLGELPPPGGNQSTRRVIDAGDAKESQELLERIQQAWPAVSPNPLLLPPSPKKKKDADSPQMDQKPEKKVAPSLPKTAGQDPVRGVIRFAELRREVDAQGDAADQNVDAASSAAFDQNPADPQSRAKHGESAPPVKVSIGADGRLVISSDDPEALDRLEELARQLAPPRKEYAVFRLKRASAYTVALNLEDYFKDDKKTQQRSPWFFYDFPQQDDSDGDARLSKRRKLKFVSDYDSNTILVYGATPSQLETIKDLISLYDQPQPTDSESARKQETIHLRFAKASVVRDAVKDVYRDLLSDNDKALENPSKREGFRPWWMMDTGDDKQKVPRFKGQLSIGIDETSNTLVVSAPAFLFDHVEKMIKALDNEAAPSDSVRVVKVPPGVSAKHVQDVLKRLQDQGSSDKSGADKDASRHPEGKPGPGGKPAGG